MTALTDFLLARITEDEDDTICGGSGEYRSCDRLTQRREDECASKRRIVEYHIRLRDDATKGYPDDHALWSVAVHQTATIVEMMVQVYAAHPDFQDEWKA
jgi:hypothetical protein